MSEPSSATGEKAGLPTGGPFPLVYMLLSLGLALLLVWAALPAGLDRFLTPTPEGTADSFVEAMAAGRYYGAWNQLSPDLQEQVSPQDLKDRHQAFEQAQGKIDRAEPQGSQQQGDTAQAELKIRFEDGSETGDSFPLGRENWVWHLTGLGPFGDP
jgi:hypothetical protein